MKLLIALIFLPTILISQELLPMKSGDLWGYINTEGEWVQEPSYQQATFFRNEMAAVMRDDKWVLINPDLNEVSREYDRAVLYSNYGELTTLNWAYFEMEGNDDVIIPMDESSRTLVAKPRYMRAYRYNSLQFWYDYEVIKYTDPNDPDKVLFVDTLLDSEGKRVLINAQGRFFELDFGSPYHYTEIDAHNFLIQPELVGQESPYFIFDNDGSLVLNLEEYMTDLNLTISEANVMNNAFVLIIASDGEEYWFNTSGELIYGPDYEPANTEDFQDPKYFERAIYHPITDQVTQEYRTEDGWSWIPPSDARQSMRLGNFIAIRSDRMDNRVYHIPTAQWLEEEPALVVGKYADERAFGVFNPERNHNSILMLSNNEMYFLNDELDTGEYRYTFYDENWTDECTGADSINTYLDRELNIPAPPNFEEEQYIEYHAGGWVNVSWGRSTVVNRGDEYIVISSCSIAKMYHPNRPEPVVLFPHLEQRPPMPISMNSEILMTFIDGAPVYFMPDGQVLGNE